MLKIDNQIVLNAFPHPAMIIDKDRKILAANDAAKAAGAEIGVYCWKGFGHAANLSDEHYKIYLEDPGQLGIQCVFCRADSCLTNGAEENDPLLQSDAGTFDTYWVPLSSNTYLHYAIDITERKQAEESLIKSQQLLKQMGRIGNIGGWSLDIDTGSLEWTEEVYKIHELESDYVPKVEAAINFYTDESKPIIGKAVQEAIKHGEAFDLELEIITAKSNLRHVHALGVADLEHRRIYGTCQDITDRKKIENENKRLTERLLLTTEAAQLGVWDWNVRESAIVCDDRMFALYGLTQAAATSKLEPWFNALHPEDKEAVLALCQSALDGEKDFDTEFRVLHADGTVKHLKANALVVMGADGKPDRMLGINLDITEHVQAEQLLLESERKFRSLVESAKAIPWEFDLQEERFIYVGPQIKNLLGAEVARWQTMADWAATIHPEDREGAVSFCVAETQQGREHIFEYRVLTSDGQIRWVVDYVTVQLKNGKPVSLSGFIFDISDIKMSTELLRTSEEKIRLILNATAEGIYGVDLNQECTFFNRAAQKLLGYEEVSILGRNLHELIAYRNQDGLLIAPSSCRVADVLATGKPCHDNDGIFWKSDGSSLNVEYNIHPIKNKGGVVGAVVTFLDISEKKKLIEQRIRSGQLSSLGELAAGVAHEINNPINGVINYAQLLFSKDVERDKQKQILNNIMKEGNRIAVFVRSLLKYAHRDRDLMTGLDIVEIVNDSLELLQQQLSKDAVSLEVDLDEALPRVFGNAQKLEQVLLNLISNSRHALNEKYPQPDPNKILRISVIKQGDESPRVRLILWDNGVGISEAHMGKIFNRFFTTKAAGVGTGLGLSLAHDILEEHGAMIHVESELGLFTKVIIDFPAFRGEGNP